VTVFDDGASAGNDRVAVAWEDRRSGVQAFVAVSNNGGTSFGTPVRASSQNGDALGPVVARAVGGTCANSAVAVGWVDFRTNGERGDPYLRRTGR
jgi:hypothetical protein